MNLIFFYFIFETKPYMIYDRQSTPFRIVASKIINSSDYRQLLFFSELLLSCHCLRYTYAFFRVMDQTRSLFSNQDFKYGSCVFFFNFKSWRASKETVHFILTVQLQNKNILDVDVRIQITQVHSSLSLQRMSPVLKKIVSNSFLQNTNQPNIWVRTFMEKIVFLIFFLCYCCIIVF